MKPQKEKDKTALNKALDRAQRNLVTAEEKLKRAEEDLRTVSARLCLGLSSTSMYR